MKKIAKLVVFTLIFCFFIHNNVQAEEVLTRKLKLGDRNTEVSTLQEILIKKGYLTGLADGSFGRNTQKALKLFQVENNLYADGIAGPKTRLLLNKVTPAKTEQVNLEKEVSKDIVGGLKENTEKLMIIGGDGFFPNKADCYGRTNCVKDVSDVWISDVNNIKKWTKLKTDSESSWARRHSFAATYFNKSIILVGGIGSEAYNDTWNSYNNGKNWVKISQNNKWVARGHHTLIAFSGKLWMLGGEDGQSEIWNSLDGKNWSNVTYSAPWGPRYDMAVVVFKEKLWLIAGYPGGENINGYIQYKYSGDVWSSKDGINWQKEVDQAPWGDIKFGHTATVLGDKIFVIGGQKTKLPNPTSIIDEPSRVWGSSDGINWKLETENPPWGKVLYNHQTITMGNKMYVLGGDIGVFNKSIWSSTDGISWTKELENTPWVPRTRFQAFIVH